MRVLLLLPTSTYRARDFMAAAVRLGADVVVATEEPSSLQHLSEYSLMTLDFLDAFGSADAVARFHEKRPLSAVVSVDEDTALVAAVIGERLGLPHNDPDAARRTRLKHEMRRALERAGVPAPEHRVLTARDDPRVAARGLRYPVVVKPVFLSGSRGVQRADDEASFVTAFVRTARLLAEPDVARRGGADGDRILVEAFIPGPGVALEALLTDGEPRPLALFDKPDPLDGPYFEETLYVTPSRLPEDVQADVVEAAADAARAIGLCHGPIHAELRLPPGGRPTVVEIAGRSIGGLCSRTLRFGVGVSLEEVILRHALGEDVRGANRETSSAGVMMIPIPKAGELEHVEGMDAAKAVDAVEDVVMTARVGARLIPLPEGASYLGFIFARAETPAEVEHALRSAHGKLRWTIRS